MYLSVLSQVGSGKQDGLNKVLYAFRRIPKLFFAYDREQPHAYQFKYRNSSNTLLEFVFRYAQANSNNNNRPICAFQVSIFAKKIFQTLKVCYVRMFCTKFGNCQ